LVIAYKRERNPKDEVVAGDVEVMGRL